MPGATTGPGFDVVVEDVSEEIAALAVFLASQDTGYITGQTHVIDGGWTAR